jgi:hypothetical protein
MSDVVSRIYPTLAITRPPSDRCVAREILVAALVDGIVRFQKKPMPPMVLA